MEEINLKLKNALPDFDESDGYALARKNLMIEERRMQLRAVQDRVKKSSSLHERANNLEDLYRMKRAYTEKTRRELLNEKISLLEKLVQ